MAKNIKCEKSPKVDNIKNEPYLISTRVVTIREYNPTYGDDRKCKCGHFYYRHFDSYDDMRAVGCKYCICGLFKEKR